MMAYDLPIQCGGVSVKPGDLVFGDVDGVVVVPQEIAADVVKKAISKVSSENKTRQELENGLLLAESTPNMAFFERPTSARNTRPSGEET